MKKELLLLHARKCAADVVVNSKFRSENREHVLWSDSGSMCFGSDSGSMCFGQIQGACALVRFREHVLWPDSGSMCFGQIQGPCALARFREHVLWSDSGSMCFGQIQGACALVRQTRHELAASLGCCSTMKVTCKKHKRYQHNGKTSKGWYHSFSIDSRTPEITRQT